MKYISTTVALLVSSLVGCGSVEPTLIVVQKASISVTAAADAKTFLLSKVVTQIPLGDRILNIQHGWGCFEGNTVDWRGGKINLTEEEFADGFRKELTKLNYKVAGDPSALFGDSTINSADFLVAGAIEKVQANVCFPFSGSPDLSVGITSKLKGSTYMRVRWQIYSRASAKVVLETTTEGSFEASEVVTGSIPLFLKNAFQANVHNLLAEPGLFELAKPSPRNSNAI